MATAETVMAVYSDRGKKGLPLEGVYRQLYSRDLHLRAYGRIYRNNGAMTPGVTAETVDAMSLEKIDGIIDALRREAYRWSPARRTHIPKKNGKKRPLGLPTWSDKLVQEALRLLLDAYYEPRFSSHSHGFRRGRGCHTALREITQRWRGVKWFIEGDIKGCFDNIDHDVLLETLSENVQDNRLRRLVSNMLKAGYMENWRYGETLSGAPQGGVASPLFSNIYLDKLDRFVEETLLPIYNRGDRRRNDPQYKAIINAAQRAGDKGDHEGATRLRKQAQSMPSRDPEDPDFRRLWYVRYADDVRHITWRWIPFAERRGLEEMTLGPAAYPMMKVKGDSSMPSKRERSEDAYGRVPPGPRDMVRTGLFKPQPPAMQAYIPRHSVLCRGHCDRTAKSSPSKPSTRWAMGRRPIQGSGRGTYVALDTSSIKGMWDRPTRCEAQGDGAAIVLRGRESRPHGEGRQVS